jgi:hypothetical protein
MRTVLLSFPLCLVIACGEDPPTETPGPAACEMAGACSGMDDCGAGDNNFKEVVFCTNCPYKPDTHVCEACACRALPIGQGGNMVANFTIPAAATGAKSFALTAVYPTMSDGTQVTCERLLSANAAFLVNNPKLQTGNSNHVAVPGGSADPTLTYRVNLFDYPGSDHLLFVQAASDIQGKGTVMAKGCASGITVPMMGTVDVALELH